MKTRKKIEVTYKKVDDNHVLIKTHSANCDNEIVALVFSEDEIKKIDEVKINMRLGTKATK